MIYKFNQFELQPSRRTLTKNGAELDVEPQVFDLITFLVSHPDRVISRDDLLESIWNGRIVSDSSISTRINQARKILGDDGRKQALIKTVHNKGFRFVGELEIIETAQILLEMPPKSGAEKPADLDVVTLDAFQTGILPPKGNTITKGFGLFVLGVLATLGGQFLVETFTPAPSPNIDITDYSEGEQIIGVPGRNTLDLSAFKSHGFTVALPPGTINDRKASDARSLYSLKNIQHVIGTSLNDRLRGTYEGNIFHGGQGDDVLEGYGGIDRLYGEEGDDILNGGYFVDEIFGGPGNDVIFVATDSPGDNIDGGEGVDTLNLSRFEYSGYLVDLQSGFSRELKDRGMGDFKLTNVENIIGSPQDDIFHVNDVNNKIDGGLGQDTVVFKLTVSEYKITKLIDDEIKIELVKDPEYVDSLRHVEHLKFSNESIRVDTIQ